MNKHISLRGVRTNNLKNIDIDIPRNQITVITGVSGSGKSSLAFDTIYAQAQNEYLESISSYSRKNFKKINRPKANLIKGLSPTIAIEQKKIGNNPRSTVGTYTEIYTLLRLLFSRCGVPQKPILYASSFSFNNPKGACRKCKGLGYVYEVEVDKLIDFNKSLSQGAIKNSYFGTGSYKLGIIESSGRFDFNKVLKNFTKEELRKLLYAPAKKISRNNHDKYASWSCEGIVTTMNRLRARRNKAKIQKGEEMSAYNLEYYTRNVCPACKGGKLKKASLQRKLGRLSISQVSNLPIDELLEWIKDVNHPLALQLKKEMSEKCKRLIDLGLEYLNLNRPIPTLSGGESQRIKIAKHLGMDLIEMIYVLDEPTIGMHPKEIVKMVNIIKKLRDKGNTVIIVEHEPEIMKKADFIIDIGPKAGVNGGKIVDSGSYKGFINSSSSLTAEVLTSTFMYKNSSKTRVPKGYLRLYNLKNNNLKSIDVTIAQGLLNLIVGASGSGKSSLVDEFMKCYPKSILIDQSPIGKSPRSNPATYTGLFDDIRQEMSKAIHCSSQLLSFNSKGRCNKCKGLGSTKYDMHFLEDVEVTCDKCKGKRFNKEVLSLTYKDKSIHDILQMSVEKAKAIFESPKVLRKLSLLQDVGLGYIKLGQSATFLSGGESQRVKLAKFLDKEGDVLILDEPTTGLHPYDIDKLLTLIQRIVDKGNTVIIVEHNIDVIRNADWVIELGPKGGRYGGELIYEGNLDEIKKSRKSIINNYL